ncbi:MAG: hypothetical protein COV52_04875 [Gammaproteobacteria bacterium CG11_big_fil_rev_8_21_14_0_20_46_22]|nr:MAG: hypothetical protein COW05_02960 [Gammaproteobacteria bacterium CG12_big_fil_rev_8_21_14_0_65_46_12]PIR11273.1 MAG: hypothetical protein COV52_04875 [Gammaproteobacteria bacterium CG11_big_fil_rev_8_21_14_0_20_46_22]
MRRLLLALLGTLAMMLPAFGQTQTATPNLSFVIASHKATIKPLSQNNYQLSLQGVRPYITYYTQRPDRQSGSALLSNFLNTWTMGGAQSFANNPPNIVVYPGQINGTANTSVHFTVGVMSNPQYNVGTGIFSCVITPLPEQTFLLDNTDLENVVLIIN